MTTTAPRAHVPPAEPWRLRAWLGPSGPWNRDALTLLVLVAALLLVGLVMSLSASFVADAESGDAFATFLGQLRFATLGMVLYLLAARTDHRVWRALAWPMLAVALVALLLVAIPAIGYEQYGSRRWLAVGPVIVQPSELAKLATLLWLGDIVSRKHAVQTELRASGRLPVQHLLIPAVPLLFVEAVLVMLEPDLGTTLVLALVVFLVLWFEGVPLRLVASLTVALALFAGVAVALAPYRLSRVVGWLDPEADPLGSGYQLLQSLYALGNGGWFGTGLGASRGKWSFIPNPETDFIFAIVGEELGLVGALVVIALFSALLVVGLRVARRAPDRFGRLVGAAVTAWLVGQAFLNIGTVIGLLPITGVTLPLVSVGGSSLVSTLVALGILTSIARADGRTDDRPARARATTETST